MSKKVNKTSLQYGGVTLTLTKSTKQAAIRYTPENKRSARGVSAPPSSDGFEMISSKRGIETRLDKMRNMPEVAMGSHVWTVGEGEEYPLIPTGNLYIEFKPNADTDDRNEVMADLGLSIKEIVNENAIRVSITPQSPNPVKCAILLQKMKKIVAVAEPEFSTTPITRAFSQPSGQYISSQWHLENTGNSIPVIDVPNTVFSSSQFKKGADAKVKQAWQAMQSLGSWNIKIAIIDTGFALDHPQLKGDGTKIRTPYNAVTRSSDVSPYVRHANGSLGVEAHGTSCAAVAAGSWDANGILGAAPNSRIIPIKLDALNDEAIKNALEHAFLNGADIISCSIGYPQPISLSTYVSNYIKKLATEGRNGKGIPVFMAAGNANAYSNNQPRAISDFAADPNAICVTASNSLDQRSSYSFFGNNAFLCAPTDGDTGVAVATASCDIDGSSRIVLGYSSRFGGTSSATPLVAGICALILSVNPNLDVGQIRGILAQSCDKIGPAGTYNANGHSPYYGFGRVNALKAVQLAYNLLSSVPAPSPQPTGSGSPAASKKGRVTSAKLNIRTGPSTSNAAVGSYKRGDVLELLENVRGWWRVGVNKYVIDDYVMVL